MIPRVVNVLRRLCTLAEERGFTEKWDPNAKVDAPAKLLSVEESKKAEEKAKAESDLEATRAKASAKFKKADSDSPAPTTESKKSGSSEKSADASKNQEKLIVELQKTAKTDAEENSPIHLAVKSKVLLPMLDALNPSKAELDKPNKHKQTALHIACQNGDYDAVEVLVKAGCSVNVSDDQDKTPLHYAVESVRKPAKKITASIAHQLKSNLYFCVIHTEQYFSCNVSHRQWCRGRQAGQEEEHATSLGGSQGSEILHVAIGASRCQAQHYE